MAITYRGEPVAVLTSRCAVFAPHIAALPDGDPLLRFVAAMCLYSLDVDSGSVPGPYEPENAELYARCLLIADEEFMLDHSSNQVLALRFCVPVEQIEAKWHDLG
jgi:hypothetical protein